MSLICAEVLAGILAVAVSARAVLAEDAEYYQPTDRGVAAKSVEESRCVVSEAKIAEMEKAFLEFGDTILSRMDQYVENPKMRGKIQRVFDLMRSNMALPRCTASRDAVPFGRENGFRYQFVTGKNRTSAFAGKSRLMQIPPNFDYKDPVVLIDLVHELAHVGHDDRLRATVSEQKYMEIHSIPLIVTIPEDEAEAIAIEVEVANVMTQGALKAAALAGKTAKFSTTNEVAKRYLNDAASEYYGHTAAHFLRFVQNAYRKTPGALLFTRNLDRI